MPLFQSDISRLFLQGCANTILLAGAAAGLYLGFRLQSASTPYFPYLRQMLTHTRFSFKHVGLVLAVTLVFTLPGLSDKSTAEPVDNLTLLCGPLLYFGSGILAVAICLHHIRASFYSAFFKTLLPFGALLGKGLLYGVAVIPPVAVLSMGTHFVLEKLGCPAQQQIVFDWLADPNRPLGVRLGLMASAIFLAPITEELLFRGILFSALVRRRGFTIGLWLPALYFAAVHLDIFAFLPLFVLGLAFSAAYVATGSLLVPIVMHALFNFTSLLIYLAGPVT